VGFAHRFDHAIGGVLKGRYVYANTLEGLLRSGIERQWWSFDLRIGFPLAGDGAVGRGELENDAQFFEVGGEVEAELEFFACTVARACRFIPIAESFFLS